MKIYLQIMEIFSKYLIIKYYPNYNNDYDLINGNGCYRQQDARK